MSSHYSSCLQPILSGWTCQQKRHTVTRILILLPLLKPWRKFSNKTLWFFYQVPLPSMLRIVYAQESLVVDHHHKDREPRFTPLPRNKEEWSHRCNLKFGGLRQCIFQKVQEPGYQLGILCKRRRLLESYDLSSNTYIVCESLSVLWILFPSYSKLNSLQVTPELLSCVHNSTPETVNPRPSG